MRRRRCHVGRGGRSVAGRMGKAGSAGERRAGPGPVSAAPASGTARRSLGLPRPARGTTPRPSPCAGSPPRPRCPTTRGGRPGRSGARGTLRFRKLGVWPARGSGRGLGVRLDAGSPGAEQTRRSPPARARGPFPKETDFN